MTLSPAALKQIKKPRIKIDNTQCPECGSKMEHAKSDETGLVFNCYPCHIVWVMKTIPE